MFVPKLALGILLGSLSLISPLSAQAEKPNRAVQVKPASQQPTIQESRVALVIGNGKYADAPLRNPVNDARAMKAALESCRFEVTLLTDASKRDMEVAIREFGDRIRNGAVGLFYFAGHGLQVKGVNYLIPVNANLEREDEVTYQAVEAGQVLDKMESAKNRMNIMILDACRNNPFSRSWRSTGDKGLAQLNAPTGSFIAFATAPGREAADGAKEHGMYTEALLAQLREPGMELEKVFKRTREKVIAASHGQQTPWESNSTVGDFFFVPAQKPVSSLEPNGESGLVRRALGAPPEAIGLLGGLQVIVNAPGAKVYVDGELRGETSPTKALNLPDMPVGEVMVKVEAPGYLPKEQSFNVQESQWAQARLVLMRKTGVEAPANLPPVTTKLAKPALAPAIIGAVKPESALSAATSALEPFQSRFGMTFVPIPAGSFTMGDNSGELDERPAHTVEITKPFAIQTTPVTVKQWKAFADATGYATEAEKDGGVKYDHFWAFSYTPVHEFLQISWRDPGRFRQEQDHPVVCISWDDAQAFLRWLNQEDPGKEYRLPTEAEWEYACKAGTKGQRPGELKDMAWFEDNSKKTTHSVGGKAPNPWGLYDMLGNASEWCQDWYERNFYNHSPKVDPQGPTSGSMRVARGGDWKLSSSKMRSAFRVWSDRSYDVQNVGFRIVMSEPNRLKAMTPMLSAEPTPLSTPPVVETRRPRPLNITAPSVWQE